MIVMKRKISKNMTIQKKKKKKLSIKKSQVKKNTIVIIKWLFKKRRLETNNKERLKNNI